MAVAAVPNHGATPRLPWERMEDVERRIRDVIGDRGPITFADFMELALYSPGAFYDTPPVGADAHFVTSPHVHDAFALLVSEALRRMWIQGGGPAPFRVVEVGAGDGTLARQLLVQLHDLPIEYTAVERSEGARSELSGIDGIGVAERLTDVGVVGPGVILANELLDNLPFRRVRMGPGGPVEVRVGIDDRGALVEVETPCDAQLVASTTPGMRAGEEVTVPEGALAFVDDLAGVLADGWAILIDYGGNVRSSGQVHGYREQRVVEDVLADPGSADITAGVDFHLIEARARVNGLRVQGSPSQRDALVSLGFDRWIRAELERQGELMRARAGVEAVRAWGDRSRATLLVDPGRLGRLRWVVLAAGEAPAPDWLGDAAGSRGEDRG
jgi:NADH dehydrogenase [ubiquinone] 1 alpha subcomplex assembly factor 7